MDVVVHEIIAVLQILPFGNAVRGDEHVDFVWIVRTEQILLLGERREQRQNGVHIRLLAGQRRQFIACSGNHGGVEAVFPIPL